MKYIELVKYMLADLLKNRYLLYELAINDLKTRYIGSYFGGLWLFIQPLVMIGILWFVVQVGFRTVPHGNYPFILWLLSGLLPWYFFSDGLQNGTNSILAQSFLVKKVVFRVALLPLVQILSALFVHLCFLIILVGVLFVYGYTPSVYWIQGIYYMISCIVLLVALTWITSSVVIFFRDLGQIVSMILQFGFWLTPIFWSFDMLPQEYRIFIQLNPVYYIVDGYRDSFVAHIWFWDKIELTLYFWLVTSVLLICGGLVFRKLKSHFSDVI